MIDRKLVERLYDRARAGRWRVSVDRFAEALEASVERAGAQGAPDPRTLARTLGALHLEDLALACACAEGNEEAWEHFVRELRPVLYRAADALEPGGGARDLADSLYADLFGLRDREGERVSLFRYFHGRSRLGTWLRAVLAQRYVDRIRSSRRLEALPDEDSSATLTASERAPDPERPRFERLLHEGLGRAVADLTARDRLRLACYYAQGLTLAETGRVLREHEATCSRHLSRTRKAIRVWVERWLMTEAGLSEREIVQCFESVVDDPGTLDLGRLLDVGNERKESIVDRSS